MSSSSWKIAILAALAFVLAGSPRPVGGMEVLGEDDQDPDDAVLHTEWQHEDDSYVHDADADFHQYSDGWKWVVPLPLVQVASACLTRQLPPQPAGR